MTSKPYTDPQAVPLTAESFASGGLQLDSYARPGKLFTTSDALIDREVGVLTGQAFSTLIAAVVVLING